jgi:hypothetical protein
MYGRISGPVAIHNAMTCQSAVYSCRNMAFKRLTHALRVSPDLLNDVSGYLAACKHTVFTLTGGLTALTEVQSNVGGNAASCSAAQLRREAEELS